VAEILAGGVVALVATAFGAWLTGRQTANLNAQRTREEERRRSLEVVAAGRLVWFELGMAAVSAESAFTNKNLHSLKGIPRTAWATHGALLAADLPDDVFAPLAEVMARLGSSVQMLDGTQILAAAMEEHGAGLQALETLGHLCRAAQDTLAEWLNAQPAATRSPNVADAESNAAAISSASRVDGA
jgi:hypothetical protein